MKTKYHTNHYSDTYSTYSQYGEKNTMVELTLGCFQLIPKTFEIPGIVDDPRNNSYHLSFFVTFKFIEHDKKISLEKIRFSLSGSQSKSYEHLDFKELSEKEEFCDFIKKEFVKFFYKTKSFVSDKVLYEINNKDQKKIKESFKYLELIFPNKKEIIIIDLPNVDFYKGQDNALEDGVLIYEKSRTVFAFKDLEQKLPVKEKPIKIKPSKI